MIHVHHFATLKQVSDKKLKNKNQKQKKPIRNRLEKIQIIRYIDTHE
jgi:hypothetical protein